jgi:hypothetical protein
MAQKGDLRKIVHICCGSNQSVPHLLCKDFEVSTFEICKSFDAFARLECLPKQVRAAPRPNARDVPLSRIAAVSI